MELFLAALTGILASLFLAYVILHTHIKMRRDLGELIARSIQPRLSLFQVLLLLLAALMVALCVYFLVTCHDDPVSRASFPMFFQALTISLFAISIVLGTPCIELRQHGIALAHRGPISGPLPWQRIRRVQWLDSRTFLVAHGDSEETFRVRPNQVPMFSDAFLAHVEVRDENGAVINPDRESVEACSFSRPFRLPPLQFSLKTLLLLMIVAGSASAWLGVHLKKQWEDEAALKALAPFSPVTQKGARGRLQLDFSKSKPGPNDLALAQLHRFQWLDSLDLSNAPISDNGLARLESLTHLSSLSLYDTQITDDGLKHLRGLTKLRYLNLSRTQITDSGLVPLKGLKNLRSLCLRGTQVTDEGIQRLQDILPNIKIER